MAHQGRYGIYKPIILKNNVVTAYTLSLSDTITLSDAETNVVGKSLSDSITLTDANIKAIGKSASDSITLTDAATKAVGISEQDSITLSDLATKAIGLSESDSITLTDEISIPIIPVVITQTGDGVRKHERQYYDDDKQKGEAEKRERELEEQNMIINFVKMFTEKCL